ncbi:MAG: hypothetical protein WCG99_01775 [Candidatus Berkelbacteria bacterium]
MRYPLITLIIAVVWVILLAVSAQFTDMAQSLYYLTLAATVIIFIIGFQARIK